MRRPFCRCKFIHPAPRALRALLGRDATAARGDCGTDGRADAGRCGAFRADHGRSYSARGEAGGEAEAEAGAAALCGGAVCGRARGDATATGKAM